MNLKAKSVGLAAAFLGLIAVALPWLALGWFAAGALPLVGRAAGVVLAVAGLALSLWCVALFLRMGEGTPAPLQPPVHLVTAGPYGLVRNPMLTGVTMLIAGEALVFASLGIAVYAAVFFAIANVLLFTVEEPALARRFGEEYAAYRQHVPRWLPRLRPRSAPPTRPA